MYAYTNILAALLQRGKTGLGKDIDVSMLESMVEWMSYPMYYASDTTSSGRSIARDHISVRAVQGW
jgi:itaconate CoA-transferase